MIDIATGGLLLLLLTCLARMTWYTVPSPSTILCCSWALFYGMQTVLAPDMYSSSLAALVVTGISSCFFLGELAGRFVCQQGHPGNSGAHRDRPSSELPPQLRHRLGTMIIISGLLCILLMGVYIETLGLFRADGLGDALQSIGPTRVMVLSGEIVIPLSSRIGILIAYPAVVLSLSYYFLYGWRWWLFMPFLGVAIFGIAQAGRAGIIIVLLQLGLTIILREATAPNHRATRVVRRVSLFVLLPVAIVSLGGQLLREGALLEQDMLPLRLATLIRSYGFGGVSAFAYFIDHSVDWLSFSGGRYSFASLFDVLGIAEQAPGVYTEYVPISPDGDTVNIFTAYRSFIDDFTIVGAAAFYLLSGVIAGYGYQRFLGGAVSLIAFVIPLFSWLAFSPWYSLTYFNSFLASLLGPYLLLRLLSWQSRRSA
jgi:oligosaccharide repeat unit polymerase